MAGPSKSPGRLQADDIGDKILRRLCASTVALDHYMACVRDSLDGADRVAKVRASVSLRERAVLDYTHNLAVLLHSYIEEHPLGVDLGDARTRRLVQQAGLMLHVVDDLATAAANILREFDVELPDDVVDYLDWVAYQHDHAVLTAEKSYWEDLEAKAFMAHLEENPSDFEISEGSDQNQSPPPGTPPGTPPGATSGTKRKRAGTDTAGDSPNKKQKKAPSPAQGTANAGLKPTPPRPPLRQDGAGPHNNFTTQECDFYQDCLAAFLSFCQTSVVMQCGDVSPELAQQVLDQYTNPLVDMVKRYHIQGEYRTRRIALQGYIDTENNKENKKGYEDELAAMPALIDNPAVQYLGFPTARDVSDSIRLLIALHKTMEQISRFTATSEFGYVADAFPTDDAPTSTYVGRGRNRKALHSVNPAGPVQNI